YCCNTYVFSIPKFLDSGNDVKRTRVSGRLIPCCLRLTDRKVEHSRSTSPSGLMRDTLSLNWNIIGSKSNQVYFLDRFLREGLSLRNILQSKNRAFVTHSICYSCHYRDWQLEFYPFPV